MFDTISKNEEQLETLYQCIKGTFGIEADKDDGFCIASRDDDFESVIKSVREWHCFDDRTSGEYCNLAFSGKYGILDVSMYFDIPVSERAGVFTAIGDRDGITDVLGRTARQSDCFIIFD